MINVTRRRAAVLLVLMGGAAALAEAAKPTKRLADMQPRPSLEQLFPKQFGPWRVDTSLPIILPAPDLQAALDALYNQVLSRTYVDDRGRRIMLSVAYGGDQSDGLEVHVPERCYVAQGFDLRSRRAATIDHGGGTTPVVRLMTRMNTRVEPVTYWIVTGDYVVRGLRAQKLVKLRYGLRGIVPDGMLVRVSNIDRDAEASFELHDAFVRDMHAALRAEGLEAHVFGSQRAGFDAGRTDQKGG